MRSIISYFMGNTDSSAESDSNGKVNAVTGHRLSDEPVKSTTIMEQNLNPYNVVNQGNMNMNNNNNIGYNGQNNNNNQFNPNNLTNEQLMQILQTNPYIAQSNPQIQQHLQYLAQLQLAQQHAHNNIQNNQYNKPVIYPQNNNVYNNNPNMYQQQQQQPQQHHAQIHQQIYPQQQQQQQQIQQNVPQPNVQPQQQERIPIKFQWTCGGREVFLAYSGDKWSQKYEMYPRNNEFQLILKLRPGIYHYKFIVDNQWRCAPDQKHVKDANGAYSNVLDVQPRNITNVNKRKTQTTNVNNNINDNNSNVSNINQNNNNNNNNQNNVTNKQQTIQSSKDKKKKNEWTQMLPHKTYYIDDPPICPLHLTKVLLNNDTKYDNYVKFADKKEDNNTALTTSNENNNDNKNDTYSDSDYSDSESSSCLPEPEKVCINHLYVNDKREEEVVTLGITERYKDKYYTTVYYKPIQSRGRIDNSYFIDKSFYAL